VTGFSAAPKRAGKEGWNADQDQTRLGIAGEHGDS
jgi:hypothetical protein